jgi:uncharacterized membrane protein
MSKKQWINNYLSEDERKDIRSAIENVERNTVGEIVLSVRDKRTWLEKLYTPHELAWKDFNRLGVMNTKERTGVMIFIIFGERYYDIIADEGIFAKIPDSTWNEMEEKLTEEFKNKNYSAGILALIEKMNGILCSEFPCRAGADNDNELSDDMMVN